MNQYFFISENKMLKLFFFQNDRLWEVIGKKCQGKKKKVIDNK